MAFFHLLALLPFTFLNAAAAEFFVPNTGPLHGIYLTSQTVASEKSNGMLDEFRRLGGNMIVFDLQDANGKLAYLSNLPLSIEIDNRKDQIKNLAQTVKHLHEKGFYVTARFVLFKNGHLARRKPEWALKRKGGKGTFMSRDGPVWLDPGHPELREYLIDIAREAAYAGVDEVQFDYVRFPESGTARYIPHSYTGDNTLSRDQVLTQFVAAAARELHYLGVAVSVDLFGILVWDDVSWRVIGQNVPELAKHADAMYPMPYPSHFGPGWGGHRNPADEPYFFVQETTKKFLEQTKGTDIKIRPWLQGFAMRVSRYGPGYIKEQIRGLTDIGMNEFAVWNARNDYRVTFMGLR